VLINGNEIFVVRIVFDVTRFNIAILFRRQIAAELLAIGGRWLLHTDTDAAAVVVVVIIATYIY